MKTYKSLLEINEMTRSGEKISKVEKVIICPFYYENEIEYIESLKYQDEKYLSYHYIIEREGNIFNIVPEEEISYPTNNISFNLKCISIGVYIKEKREKINRKQEKSLISLIKNICNKYNLVINKDVLIFYDICCTREFEYYIDNYFEFEDIKEKIKKYKKIPL